VIYADTLKTPWGQLAILWFTKNGQPIVTGAGFCSVKQLFTNWSDAASRDSSFATELAEVPKPVSKSSSKIRTAVNKWVKGDYKALRSIKVIQPGPEFRQDVWATLREVKAGDHVSYQELADMAGRPKAVRAAASACSNNLAAPFVPCHRVTRSGGDLGKYAYGLKIKKSLLQHEGAPVA
jgi:methylated-DNA-[protein]-cysteine S-methyltransferase